MPTHSTEIPYELRVAVIALRMLAGYTFSTIATKLNLNQTSVNKVYSRAMERTDSSLRDSFSAVVKNVRDAPRSGRPSVPSQGSASLPFDAINWRLSALIHAAANFVTGISENIPKNRNPLCDEEPLQLLRPIKPNLSFDFFELRVGYAHKAIREQRDGVCSIFFDEM